MKKISVYLILALVGIFTYSCDPAEDRSLIEENFENAGTPISKEELLAALEVSQPLPNVEGVVEGDQYIVVNNKRKDIGGTWVLELANGTKTSKSDYDTIVSTENGILKLYYQGVSAGKIVKTDPILVTVTNVFDEYERILSGAADKSDKTAKKTWKFMEATGALYTGMYGNWKYYDPVPNQNSWGTIDTETVPEQTMTFEYDRHKMTTYLASGAVSEEGGWSFTHDTPEGVKGELITTVPVIGTSFSRDAWSGVDTPYWIVSISEDLLVLCFPSTYNKPADVEDWDIHAMYFFLVPEK